MTVNENLFNALKTAYGKGSKLGLDDEVIGTVAALKGSAEMNEEQIAEFVAAAEPIFKREQSIADRERTKLHALKKELEGKVAELEAKLNGNQPNSEPKPTEQPDFKAMLAEALAEVVNPLKEELATFKAEQSAKSALANAEATFKGNDYVKKYGDEAADAWEFAMALCEYNKDWTAEQIEAKAMEKFNKAVAKRGVDTTKPLPSDGGGGEAKADFSGLAEKLKEKGLLPKDNQN